MPLNPKDVKSPALTEQMVGKGEKMKKQNKTKQHLIDQHVSVLFLNNNCIVVRFSQFLLYLFCFVFSTLLKNEINSGYYC